MLYLCSSAEMFRVIGVIHKCYSTLSLVGQYKPWKLEITLWLLTWCVPYLSDMHLWLSGLNLILLFVLYFIIIIIIIFGVATIYRVLTWRNFLYMLPRRESFINLISWLQVQLSLSLLLRTTSTGPFYIIYIDESLNL